MAASPSKANAAATRPLSSQAGSCSSLWTDLPPELAGLVLRRLPSLADRVRFGSICRHWRHAAQQQAPMLAPVLPWTITSYTRKVQTIPDGEVHRLCSGQPALCLCSSENWLLMIGRSSQDDDTERNFLENPLSGAILPLPSPENLLRPGGGLHRVTKFIVCRGDLVVAAAGGPIAPHRDPLVACCRPGTSSWSTSTQVAGDGCTYQDIAFYGRSIYAITEAGDLLAHEISEDHGYGPVVSSAKLVIKAFDTRSCAARRFLVVSRGGRLLMVKWNYPYGIYDDDDGDISDFKVYEADLQMSTWSRLWSIGDQALFVSRRCSKAVPVSSHDDYLCGNRIYFLDDIAAYGPEDCHVWGSCCGIYDLGDNEYYPIVSDRFHANHITATAWFFPHK